MASAKSSRSRASAPSGVISSGFQQPSVQESGVQLADKLKIFKTDNFDFDAYVQSKCQTMNEKEIRHLCSYLQELNKASAEEMRKSVYANYTAFVSGQNYDLWEIATLGKSHRSWRFHIRPHPVDLTRPPG